MWIVGTTSWAFNDARLMPKKQLAIFIMIDVILVLAVIIAVLHHVRVIYALGAFIVLSVINGLFLIVTVLRNTRTPG